MLSSVLRSDRAVRVNVEIMRTFVRLRRILATHEDLARKLDDLEKRYDAQFKVVFDAIRGADDIQAELAQADLDEAADTGRIFNDQNGFRHSVSIGDFAKDCRTFLGRRGMAHRPAVA